MSDDKQYKDAVETKEKHLRIIACAGSGKTRFVAERVAFLLKSGILPENIIAFTYTEKAAAELNSRIVKVLKDQNILDTLKGFADMYIGTIHGWCLKALRDNEIGYQKYNVLDEIKLRLFVDKNYKEIGMRDITKIGNPDVCMKIFTDTNRFVQLMNIIRESDLTSPLPANIAAAKEKFEKLLKDNGYFDFTQIMIEAHRKLQHNSSALFKKIKADLKFLIVDEYQDVNPIQENIIYELNNISSCKVTVVGDDDQNIFQWRGSNSIYLRQFDEKYSHTSPVLSFSLGTNFRSSKGITGLAELFISKNKERIKKDMKSAERQEFIRNEDILYNEYNNIQQESEDIVERVKNLRGVVFSKDGKERGIDFSDFSVLLRTWRKSEPIVEILERNNIPYITAGVNQLFQTHEVRAALAIFSYLNSDISDDDLFRYWKAIPNNKIDDRLLKESIKALDNFFPANFQKDRKSVSWGDYRLQEIFWDFLRSTDIVEETFISPDNANSSIQAEVIFYNLGKFSQVINDYEEIYLNSSPPSFHLFNFLSFIKYAAQDYYSEGWLNNPYKTPNAVQLMTVHQAKGLEFPVVFIPGMNKNYFPLKKPGGLSVWHFLERSLIKHQERYEASTDEQRFEDERRLLYVAMTRSQKFLFISRAPDLDNQLYKVESPFINELVSDFILKPLNKIDFSKRKRMEPEAKAETINISLNFSVLKDFFQCNYRFKLVSMYGFCFPLNQRMGLGRSLHDSLMAIHKKISEGEKLNDEKIRGIAREQSHFPYMGKSPELEKMKVMVEDGAVKYFEKNAEDLKNIEYVEQDIKLDLDGGIYVSGRIDLIKKKSYEGVEETTIMEFKSNDRIQTRTVSVDQLNLYALGYKELTGHNADYIQVYDVEKNQPEHRSKIEESLLDETRQKIHGAADGIRKQQFPKIDSKNVCKECFQNSICYNRIKFNLRGKK